MSSQLLRIERCLARTRFFGSFDFWVISFAQLDFPPVFAPVSLSILPSHTHGVPAYRGRVPLLFHNIYQTVI